MSKNVLYSGVPKPKPRKRRRLFGEDPELLEKQEEVLERSAKSEATGQIELFLKESPDYPHYLPLPYEILIKIFNDLITCSNQPVLDLLNLSRVCEGWRQIIIHCPRMWRRLLLDGTHITKRNISVLKRIYSEEFVGMKNVEEFSLSGFISEVDQKTLSFLEDVMGSSGLKSLRLNDLSSKNPTDKLNSTLMRSLGRSNSITSLTVSSSKHFYINQKWIVDYIVEKGQHLNVLDLSMTFSDISSQLQRAIFSDCINLKVLDLTTYDSILSHSFDATALAASLPNLEVLRAGNISFRPINIPPANYGLPKLREISIPMKYQDYSRGDSLFATLAFGSESITVIDIRGSAISPYALLSMPSWKVEQLHIDDVCSDRQYSQDYWRIVERWSRSLRVLGLTKLNCPSAIKFCLRALYKDEEIPQIKEIDLSSTMVEAEELKNFLESCRSLELIDLTSCRALPRGCKGLFYRHPPDPTSLSIDYLMKKLKMARV